MCDEEKVFLEDEKGPCIDTTLWSLVAADAAVNAA
jgi:hypothetical protein